jgi:hypothetical protein
VVVERVGLGQECDRAMCSQASLPASLRSFPTPLFAASFARLRSFSASMIPCRVDRELGSKPYPSRRVSSAGSAPSDNASRKEASWLSQNTLASLCDGFRSCAKYPASASRVCDPGSSDTAEA